MLSYRRIARLARILLVFALIIGFMCLPSSAPLYPALAPAAPLTQTAATPPPTAAALAGARADAHTLLSAAPSLKWDASLAPLSAPSVTPQTRAHRPPAPSTRAASSTPPTPLPTLPALVPIGVFPRLVHIIVQPRSMLNAELHASNARMLPGFEFRAYDEADMLAAYAAEGGDLGRRLLKAHARLNHIVLKADLFRLFIVHAVGGVYIDHKGGFLRNLDWLGPMNNSAFINFGSVCISNGQFAASRGHPAIFSVLHAVLGDILRGACAKLPADTKPTYHLKVVHLTGPRRVHAALEAWAGPIAPMGVWPPWDDREFRVGSAVLRVTARNFTFDKINIYALGPSRYKSYTGGRSYGDELPTRRLYVDEGPGC